MLGSASGFKWDLLYPSMSGESPTLVETVERHRPAEGVGVPLLWWIIALPVWTPAPPLCSGKYHCCSATEKPVVEGPCLYQSPALSETWNVKACLQIPSSIALWNFLATQNAACHPSSFWGSPRPPTHSVDSLEGFEGLSM